MRYLPLSLLLLGLTSLACNIENSTANPMAGSDWGDLQGPSVGEPETGTWAALNEEPEESAHWQEQAGGNSELAENSLWKGVSGNGETTIQELPGNPFDLQTPEMTEVLNLVNENRQAGAMCGDDWYPPVPTLRWNRFLAEAALAHSEDMATQGYFSHTSLDGRSFVDRIGETAYAGAPRGENIAVGYGNAAAVMDGWMNSPGHCRNIMAAGSNEIGVGRSNESSYWTQKFGNG